MLELFCLEKPDIYSEELQETDSRRPTMFTRALVQEKIDTSLSRDQVVEALRGIAQEWQEAAAEEDKNLLEVKSSPGLLLLDVMEALGLTYQEQASVLQSDSFTVRLAIGDPVTISA